MKRSRMILQMQRFYNIRHVMLEGGNITLEQFMIEFLDYQESLGMRPPYDASQDDEVDTFEWEPENE